MSPPRDQTSIALLRTHLIAYLDIGLKVLFPPVTILITSILPSKELSMVLCAVPETRSLSAIPVTWPGGRWFKSNPRHQETNQAG